MKKEDDYDKETDVQIPKTVGDMIKFLQKFPKDCVLDFYYTEDRYSDIQVIGMKVQLLKNYPALEITFR